MKFRKRLLVGLTFYFCCTAVVLLCVACGTKFWIESNPAREVDVAANVTTQANMEEGRFEGTVHLGLFEAYKKLNHGLGSRETTLWIVCWLAKNVCIWSPEQDYDKRLKQLEEEYTNVNKQNQTLPQHNVIVKAEYNRNAAFIDFRLWLATTIFLALAILFGVVGAGFALLNAMTTPIECITGVRGLYVWNAVAAIFTLICIIMWVVLYYLKFKDNVMSNEELQIGWKSKDRSSFGYSFWIVVGAMLLYIINLVIIFISSIEPEYQRRTNAVVNEKPADGVIMLF